MLIVTAQQQSQPQQQNNRKTLFFLKHSLSHLGSNRLLRPNFDTIQVLKIYDCAGIIWIFCWQNILILPAESSYSPKSADVYLWKYIILDSTIFCQQNIQILPAESSYNPKSVYIYFEVVGLYLQHQLRKIEGFDFSVMYFRYVLM